ncbi:hypothetical protein BDW72DRAFT_169642 [Aspergillus terricola var. indicus]
MLVARTLSLTLLSCRQPFDSIPLFGEAQETLMFFRYSALYDISLGSRLLSACQGTEACFEAMVPAFRSRGIGSEPAPDSQL